MFRLEYLLVIIFVTICVVYSQSITTSDCDTKYGCYRSPSGCVDTGCQFIFKWQNKTSDQINFIISANIGGNLNSRWLAIGFSKDTNMGDDSVVVCKGSGVIESYYNPGTYTQYLTSANSNYGLSSPNVTKTDTWLICSFVREKKMSDPNFFDLSNNYYILAANGNFDPNGPIGSISKHEKLPQVSSDKVNFLTTNSVQGGNSSKADKAKAHACLMVIAWMLFATVGMFTARYFKSVLLSFKLCNTEFWFAIHRAVMPAVPLLSIISLLVILSYVNWRWIETTDKLEFVHSIFGIIAIILSFIQPFIGLVRCDKTHKYRFIFNYVHRSLGILALLCSIIALFLGSVIKDLNLENKGWGIILGWLLWMVLIIVTLEIINFRRQKTKSYIIDERESSKIFTLDFIFFLLHVAACLAYTIALLVVIGKAQS